MPKGNRDVPIANSSREEDFQRSDFNIRNNCFEDVQPPARSCLEMLIFLVNILCLGGNNLSSCSAIITKKSVKD